MLSTGNWQGRPYSSEKVILNSCLQLILSLSLPNMYTERFTLCSTDMNQQKELADSDDVEVDDHEIGKEQFVPIEKGNI